MADPIDPLAGDPEPVDPLAGPPTVEPPTYEEHLAPQPVYREAGEGLVPAPLHLGKPGEVTVEPPSTYQLTGDQADRAARLKTIFDQSWVGDADRAGNMQRFAKAANLRFDVVRDNYPELKRSYEVAGFDSVKWMNDNPALAKLVLDHPELAATVERDQPISVLAQTLNYMKDNDPSYFLMQHPGLSPEEFKEAFAADVAQRHAPKKQVMLQDEEAKAMQDGWSVFAPGSGIGVPNRVLVPFKRFGEMWDQMNISAAQYQLKRKRDAEAAKESFGRLGEAGNVLLGPQGVFEMGDPNESSYELENRINDMKLAAMQRDYNEGPVEQVFTDAMQAAASSTQPMIKQAAPAALIAGAATLAVTRSPALAGEAAAFMGKAGAVYGTYQMETGSAYGDMLDHGIPERTASAASSIYGVLAAGIEFASWGPMFKALGPAGALIKEGSTEAFAKALAKSTTFKKLVMGLGSEALAEGGEEFLQDATQQAAEYFARAHHVGFAKADSLSGVDLNQSLEAGVKGFTGGLALGLGHTGINMATRGIFKGRAEESRNIVEALASFGDSPTALADPDAAAEMIAESHPGLKNLYTEPHGFIRLMQDAKLEPAQVAEELLGPGGADALTEAVATGGKLEVPVAKFIDWKNTELKKALVEHTTTEASLPTPGQIDEKAAKERVDALVASFEKADEKGEDVEPETLGEHQFLDAMQDELSTVEGDPTTARQKMHLWRAVIRTWSERLGVSASEWFRDAAVQIRAGQNPTMAEILSARAANEEFREKGRADELYRDEPTGLPNRAAYEATPRKPGHITGHLSFEGVKWDNDNGNHKQTDTIMMAVAAALHAQGVDPHRVGAGDFAFDVPERSASEAMQAAIEKTRAALPEDLRGFAITGAVGPDLKSAAYVNQANIDAAVAKGERANPRPVLLGEDGEPLRDSHGDEQVLKPERPKGLAEGATPSALAEKVKGIAKATPELAEALKRRAEGLSNIDYFNEAYVDPETGCWTKKAWDAMPRKKHVASLDLAGLRRANLRYGKVIGDKMLFVIKHEAMQLGGATVDFTQQHGDEFCAQSDDPKALEGFVEAVRARLNELAVPYFETETGELISVPLEFHNGFSDDYSLETADADLNDRKERLKQARKVGLERRGDQPARSGGQQRADEGGAGRRSEPEDRTAASDAAAQQVAAQPFITRRLSPLEHKGDDYSQARAAIARARSNKAAMQKWFTWCVDMKWKGEEPKVPFHVISVMARYGVVGPNGFEADQYGRDLRGKKLATGKKQAGTIGDRMRNRGVGLQGNAADVAEERKSTPASRLIGFQEAPDHTTLFYQFPTPEESLQRMQEEQVLRDTLLAAGAEPVESVDMLVKSLHRMERKVEDFGDQGGDAVIVHTSRGDREFSSFEYAQSFIEDGEEHYLQGREDAIKEGADGLLSNRDMQDADSADGRDYQSGYNSVVRGEPVREPRVIYGASVRRGYNAQQDRFGISHDRRTEIRIKDANAAQNERLNIRGEETSFEGAAPDIETNLTVGRVLPHPMGGEIYDEKKGPLVRHPGSPSGAFDSYSPAADIPDSKNLPHQAALERATATGLGTMLGGAVIIPPGYTGKVVLKQGSVNQRGAKFDTTDLRSGRETLEKYGLPRAGEGKSRGGFNNVRDIYTALQERQRALFGRIAPNDYSKEAQEKIAKGLVNIVLEELRPENVETSGAGWYGERYKAALEHLAKLFPELKKDRVARATFTAIVAITSNGQKVLDNYNMAAELYAQYREKQRWPTKKPAGKRGPQMLQAFQRLQDLVDEHGGEALHKMLMVEDTVSNHRKLAKQLGIDEDLGDFAADEVVPRASVVISPKLGTFFGNLMGADGYLTMDMWWCRTINTMRGDIITEPRRIAIDNFKKILANRKLFEKKLSPAEKRDLVNALPPATGISDAQAFKEATKLERIARKGKNYGKAFPKGPLKGQVFPLTAIESSGNELWKQKYEKLEESPRNAGDRSFMINATKRAQKILEGKGRPLSIADIQALSWFYEQRLIRQLGGKVKSDVSYDEVAEALVDARKAGRDKATSADVAAVRERHGLTEGDQGAAGEVRGGARGQASKAVAKRTHLTRFHQFPSPEESLQRLREERSFREAALITGRVVGDGETKKSVIKAAADVLRAYGDPNPAVMMHRNAQRSGDDLLFRGHPDNVKAASDFIDEWPADKAPLGPAFVLPSTPNTMISEFGAEDANLRQREKLGIFGSKELFGDVSIASAPQEKGGDAIPPVAMENSTSQLGAKVTTGERGSLESDQAIPLHTALEALAKLKEAAEQDWHPNESIPEDHYALYAGEHEAPRGYTEVMREGTKRLFKLVLNPNADHSTFLHESAHIFLELMTELQKRPDAPARLKEDYATVLKWLDAKGPEDLVVPENAPESHPNRQRHEKWARGFERYLLEGKSPTKKLVRMFERFRLWLSKVYRDPQMLRVDLSDDIRQVFDRMVATDIEIERFRKSMGLETPPLAKDVFEHPDDYERYVESRVELTASVTRRLDHEAAKDKLREQEAWWKDELKKEKALAEEAYEKLPARVAQQTLAGKGELSGPGGGEIRLARERVIELVGEQHLKKFRTTTKESEKVDPDEVADFVGFTSGKEMLEGVLGLQPKDAWVKATATDAMAQKHHDVVEDREKLREQVSKGLHGDATLTYLLHEWAALRVKMSKPGAKLWEPQVTPIEETAKAAKQIVDRKRVGRLDAGAYLRSERKAADDCAKAAAKGNFAQAFAFKQQQLLNMLVWRELTAAVAERAKFLDLAAQMAKDVAGGRTGRNSTLGKASPVYREGAASLLEAVGLMPPGDGPGATIEDVLRQMALDNQIPGFDEAELEQIAPGPDGYKSLTVAEMRVVNNALASIKAAAKGTTTSLDGEKRLDYEDHVALILDDAGKHLPPLEPGTDRGAETLVERIGDLATMADGEMLTHETMVNWLGNNDVTAPVYRALVVPLQQGKHKEADTLREVIKPIVKAFEKMPARNFAERIKGDELFPGHTKRIKAPTRRWQLLMMLLNSGNQSNLDRLTNGRGITEQQLRDAAVTVGITKEEYDWIQSVWDACEALKKPAFDLDERDTGVRPEAIEPRAFQTPYGMVKGGYFPAVYSRLSETPVGEKQGLAQFADPTYLPIGTPRSHLKARAEEFSDIIDLAPQSIYRHLSQVAHDIAFREAVKSVGRLVLDPRIKDMLTTRLGEGRAKTFLQYVKDVGQQRGIEGATTVPFWLSLSQGLRGAMSLAVLGGALPNALEDAWTGLATAVSGSDLEAKHLAAGIAEMRAFVPGAGNEAVERAEKMSGELRSRRGSMSRELLSTIDNLITRLPAPLARGARLVKDHAFFMQEMIDRTVSTSLWLGAHRQAVAKGMSEKDSVIFADKIVRDLLPSHHVVDTSAILRDRGIVGGLLLFFRFWNKAYNTQRRFGPKLTPEASWQGAKQVGNQFGYLFGFAILGSLVRGQGPDPGEPWETWFARKLSTGALGMIPGLGDLAELGWGLWTGGLAKKREPRNNSWIGMLSGIIQLAARAQDGDRAADERLEAALKGLSLTLGAPATQPIRTGFYGYRAGTGSIPTRGAGDVVGGAVYGQGEHQPANIPTLIQDAIEGGPEGLVEHPGPH